MAEGRCRRRQLDLVYTHARPYVVMRITGRDGTWAGGDNLPGFHRGGLDRVQVLRRPPLLCSRGTGQQRSRPDHVHDLRGRREKRDEEAQDGGAHFVAPSTQQLTGAVLLHPLESECAGPVDKLVGGLNKLLLQLLQLLLLLGPGPSVGIGVDREDFLMILDQRIDGVCRQLEGDLILGNHVYMNNISLDVNELEVEQRLHERIRVLSQLGFRGFRHHQRAQRPDGVRGRESFRQASGVLRDAVQRTLDLVDALEGGRQPWFDLGVEDDIAR